MPQSPGTKTPLIINNGSKCGSPLAMVEKIPDTCMWCARGKGFRCARHAPMG